MIKEPLSRAQETELLNTIREINEIWEKNRLATLYSICQEKSKEDYFLNRDFYIVLVPTNERNEEKTPLDRFFVRRSCPTPGYNHSVWKYRHTSSELEYLWTIPRKAKYWEIYNNKHKYLANPKTKRMASFVCSMESGQLLEWVKNENNEAKDKINNAVIKVNNPVIEA